MPPIITALAEIPSPLVSAIIVRGLNAAQISAAILRIRSGAIVPAVLSHVGSIIRYPGLDLATFEGVALEDNDLILKPATRGDCDLDGTVSGDDMNLWVDGFNGTFPPCWLSGDFDYNGTVNAADRDCYSGS